MSLPGGDRNSATNASGQIRAPPLPLSQRHPGTCSSYLALTEQPLQQQANPCFSPNGWDPAPAGLPPPASAQPRHGHLAQLEWGLPLSGCTTCLLVTTTRPARLPPIKQQRHWRSGHRPHLLIEQRHQDQQPHRAEGTAEGLTPKPTLHRLQPSRPVGSARNSQAKVSAWARNQA